ncbi:methylated-DNA--[protein]-cysteine S-methyltransferase [Chloroflexia bacterium SDU3-3]|nr:methylated-DNA--[protein]-cysteine S-methyltransferase [Chloroflexia bacterium SDU3-3]
MRELEIETIATPIGDVVVVCDSGAAAYIDFADNTVRRERLLAQRYGAHALVSGAAARGLGAMVARYFAGELGALDAMPVTLGGTEFQRRVWLALRGIAAGSTSSYGALAARLGLPGAARAVGLANSLNPISLALPCHRVVGADGSLTGYAGGLERKRWLLRHEGALAGEAVQLWS